MKNHHVADPSNFFLLNNCFPSGYSGPFRNSGDPSVVIATSSLLSSWPWDASWSSWNQGTRSHLDKAGRDSPLKTAIYALWILRDRTDSVKKWMDPLFQPRCFAGKGKLLDISVSVTSVPFFDFSEWRVLSPRVDEAPALSGFSGSPQLFGIWSL